MSKLFVEFVKNYKLTNPFTVLDNDSFDYPCDILIFHHSEYDKVTVFMELRVTQEPENRKWAKIENSSARRVYNSISNELNDTSVLVPFDKSYFKDIEQYA